MEQPRVSAICITDRRIDFLRRSTNCFLKQTYPNKELVVVFPLDDDETGEYLAFLNSPEIMMIPVDPSDPLTLGDKRNLGIHLSTGSYFCTWDDDDWYNDNRITNQVAALMKSGNKSITLSQVLLYDAAAQQGYLSFRRPWEQTLLCERRVVTQGNRYSNVNRGEDSVLIASLNANGAIDLLDDPTAYIYIYHGGNTWYREHWQQNIFRPARKLESPISNTISRILDGTIEHGTVALSEIWQQYSR